MHMELLPAELRASLPALYSQEGSTAPMSISNSSARIQTGPGS